MIINFQVGNFSDHTRNYVFLNHRHQPIAFYYWTQASPIAHHSDRFWAIHIQSTSLTSHINKIYHGQITLKDHVIHTVIYPVRITNLTNRPVQKRNTSRKRSILLIFSFNFLYLRINKFTVFYFYYYYVYCIYILYMILYVCCIVLFIK